MPKQDNSELLEAELNRRAPGLAPKFAEHMSVSISPKTHGEWEEYKEGIELWRLRIYSKGAKSINLGFTKFNMPENGSLILYPMGKKDEFLGPFTPMDNEEHEQLWTPIVEGEELVIEVQVPTSEKDELELKLSSVNHDFIGFSQSNQSGSCNLDVICGSEDGWGIVDGYRDIIRSVAVISLGGGTFCTGFLVNNANNDCKPFFITAEHCGVNNGNAASLVTYWNFENSTCRQPNSSESGGNGDGELLEFNTGSTWRAAWANSDMTLVELDDPVDESVNAYFAGWSNENVMPEDTMICIHHPDTDEKRISFAFDTGLPGSGGSNPVDISSASHIIVQDWDIGTTEPGSSGSPLFNKNKQVVGKLTGGGAACGNNLYDTYGWFKASWTGGGGPTTSLSSWLDPNDTGIVSIGGRECNVSIISDVIQSDICGQENAEYTISISEGFAEDVTLSVAPLADGLTASFDPNPVSPGATSVMTLSNTSDDLEGEIAITIEGTDGENISEFLVNLTIVQDVPSASILTAPSNQSVDTKVTPELMWEADELATSYTVEVALDEDFTSIITTMEVEATQTSTTPLEALTTYYWRVLGINICGESSWSEVWSFTTASCGAALASDIPLEIIASEPNDVTSTLTILAGGVITDLNLIDLDIPHTYVGDLSATLESPMGTIVQLFDRPGVPESTFGCGADNLLVSFDDEAANSADDFENACDGSGIAIFSDYQSIDPLSVFNGEQLGGQWTLTVSDAFDGDGGSIEGWTLGFCTEEGSGNFSLITSQNSFSICTEEMISFEMNVGSDFESTGVNLSATGNPAGSEVIFGSNPALPGQTIDVTIMNINTGGNFEITIIADDGTNTGQAIINADVIDVVDAATLNTPPDQMINVALIPTFEWSEIAEATSYEFQISEDEDFSNIAGTFETMLTSFTIPSSLEEETTYYWRVFANGECGTSTSSTSSFVTEKKTSISVWEEDYIAIVPNPSNGHCTISHNQASETEELIEIFSIDGKSLKTYQLNKGETNLQIDLSGYNTGIYLLRISSSRGQLTKKLLLQN